MDFLLQPILAYLLLYKYWALFLVTFLSAIALPLPSAPSLMAAAAFAGQGYFNIAAVVLVATAGNIAGDLICYLLARKYGRPVLVRLGFKRFLESPTYDWIQDEFREYRFWAVFLSRINVLTTITVNIVAGLTRMPLKTFFYYALLGETVQVLFYTAIGYAFGSNWQAIYGIFGRFTVVLILAILLLMTMASNKIQKRLARRRRAHIAARQR